MQGVYVVTYTKGLANPHYLMLVMSFHKFDFPNLSDLLD